MSASALPAAVPAGNVVLHPTSITHLPNPMPWTVTWEQAMNLLEEMEVVASVDTGSMIVHTGRHPVAGRFAIVTDALGGAVAITSYRHVAALLSP